MELTPAQAERRTEKFAGKLEQVDRTTEAVAAWWMDHQRQMAAIDEEQKRKERDSWRQPVNDEIADANVRWSKACKIHGGMRDPDSSMAAAARAEGAQFQEEQEALRRDEAKESDPAKRGLISTSASYRSLGIHGFHVRTDGGVSDPSPAIPEARAKSITKPRPENTGDRRRGTRQAIRTT